MAAPSAESPESNVDDFPKLDVIAVGAHPDDVEIACGGTIASLTRQGYRVGIIDLTDGEPTPGSPGPEVRLAEAKKAAELLGVETRITLDLPNRRLFDSFEARVALGKEFRRYRPRLVIGFGQKTPLASPDHWQAMQITDAGIFYSRLTKWDDYFDGLPVHTVSTQLYFSGGIAAPDQPDATSGQIVVDISDTLDVKLDAIRCYETQFPGRREKIIEGIRILSIATGITAGTLAGETFFSPRPIRTRNLMQSLFANDPSPGHT